MIYGAIYHPADFAVSYRGGLNDDEATFMQRIAAQVMKTVAKRFERPNLTIGGHHMHRGTNWVIIGTETTGIRSPICAVEIAAQRMCGWQRDGAPFHVLLNHDVEIEPQAQAIHGYSRAYLRQNGLPPHEAHGRFRDYVGPSPIVAHNLSYDWDRVLYPEYQRLGVPVTGRRGFCALTLARRVVSETSGHGLDALASRFCPSRAVDHNALPDTLIVVELFEKVYGPRLVVLRPTLGRQPAPTGRQAAIEHILVDLLVETGLLALMDTREAETIVQTVLERNLVQLGSMLRYAESRKLDILALTPIIQRHSSTIGDNR